MCAPIVKDPAFTQHSRGWRIPLISNPAILIAPKISLVWKRGRPFTSACMRRGARSAQPDSSALARSRLLFLALVRLLACGRLRTSGRTLAEEAQRVLHGMRDARLRLGLRRLEIL